MADPQVRRSYPQTTTGKAVIKSKKKPSDLDRRRADPGLRSKLPDSALTPEQRRQRALNQRLDSPAGPGSDISRRDLAHLLDAAVADRFGETDMELARRGRALDYRQNTQIPDWFRSYQSTVAQAQAAEAARAQQVQSLQQFAGIVGNDLGLPAGADPAAQQRAQAAAAVRSGNVANQAALMQTLGQNQQAFLGNLQLTAQGQRYQALNDVGQMRGDLAAQATSTARDKGRYRESQAQSILDAEQKAKLEQMVFGLNQSKAAADIDLKRGIDPVTGKPLPKKPKSASEQKTQREIDFFDEHGYWPPTGPPKDPKKSGKDEFGNTPKQRLAANDSFDRALRMARRALKSKPELKNDPQKLVDFLISENINTTFASGAVQAAIHSGRLGPKTKERLRRRGVTKFPTGTPKAVEDAAGKIKGAIGDILP